MRDAARSFDGYHLNRSSHRDGTIGVAYDAWDADKIRGCICDPGYEGYDCSLVKCDVGDDRRTVGGQDEVAHLFCRCAEPCNGTLTMHLGGEQLYPLLNPTDTPSTLQGRLGALRALTGLGGAAFPEPIKVRSSSDTLCSAEGTTTSIAFLRDSGDVPPLWVDASELQSPSLEVYMETNQTLACSCTACSGSFALVYDGRVTHALTHDTSAAEVQHALLSLPSLNAGDVRVETKHSGGGGLCGGDDLVIQFTTPLGNQPVLQVISSLLQNGEPIEPIEVHHTTGQRERLECNGIGFCDKAGNITIDFEETAAAPTNGTCACDEGFEADGDFGSCGRPEFNTSAWTGLQRCPGYVTKDTALDPVDVLNFRWVYVADNSNSTAVEILEMRRAAGANITEEFILPGMYTNGPLEPPEECGDCPQQKQLWNLTNSSAGGVALDLQWREIYYVDRTIRGVRVASLKNQTAQIEAGMWTEYREKVNQSRVFHDSDSILLFNRSWTIEGLALNLIPGERGLYYADPRGNLPGEIHYVDLEPSIAHNGPRLVDRTQETNLTSTIMKQGISLINPHSVALDLINRKLYWTDSGERNMSKADGKVYRSNLDGTDAVCVLDKGLYDPAGLVLDLRNYSMVVLDQAGEGNNNGAIIKANMGYETDIREAAKAAGVSNDVYDWYRNKTWVQRIATFYDASALGGNREERIKQPYGIVHDVINDMLYWTDSGTGHVVRSDVNGSLGDAFKPTAFMRQGAPMGIALDNGLGPVETKDVFECWGHGYCGGAETNHTCICDQGWYGNCNVSTCPQGPAWFDQADGVRSAHRLAECSNAGSCDHATGLCRCALGFEGGACERLSCPIGPNGESCSGHGECLTLRQLAADATYNGEPLSIAYGSGLSENSTAWDADFIQHCKCTATGFGNNSWYNLSAWTGYDCSRRACPTGDYPFRSDGKHFEKQYVECKATSGSLLLSFRGATTQPISYDASAQAVKQALEALPTIGSVSVSGDLFCVPPCLSCAGPGSCAACSEPDNACDRACDVHGDVLDVGNFTVVFTSELGDVPPLRADASKLAGTVIVGEAVSGSKEDVVCSHRGTCDEATGACECLAPYTSSDANNSFGLRGDCGFMQYGGWPR